MAAASKARWLRILLNPNWGKVLTDPLWKKEWFSLHMLLVSFLGLAISATQIAKNLGEFWLLSVFIPFLSIVYFGVKSIVSRYAEIFNFIAVSESVDPNRTFPPPPKGSAKTNLALILMVIFTTMGLLGYEVYANHQKWTELAEKQM